MNRFSILVIGIVAISFRLGSTEPLYDLKPDNQLEVNSVLASVNGEPISLWDILPATRQQEFQAYAAYSGEQLYEEIRLIRHKAVDDLIDQKLMIMDYHDKPFEISKQEIEVELDNIAERMGYRARREFIQEAQKAGSSIDKIRKNVEERLIAQLMLIRQVHIEENITPKEIYEHYQAHKGEFIVPEAVELGIILLAPERGNPETIASEISSKLAVSPDSFADLALRYSSGPDAGGGGNLGLIECRHLRPEFAVALVEPMKGKIYGPIKTADGISFLKVLDYRPEEQRELRQMIPEIRNHIEMDRREKIKSSYTSQLRQNAIIRYFF